MILSSPRARKYDGEGRRMRSKLAGAANWTEFVHDELTGEILMEYTLVGGVFTIKAVNTWGLGLISTNREGTKRYFHFDGLGSTRALTDSSENVTDTYEYNAFGVLEASSGSSVNPYRYVGQYGYYDDGAMGSASGLLLLGVRYYSPAHGRFWSWDPVPNINLYAYVSNSATMAIDPTGTLFWIVVAVAAVVCAGGCGKAALEDLAECSDTPSCRFMCERYNDSVRRGDWTHWEAECLVCCDDMHTGTGVDLCASECYNRRLPCLCPRNWRSRPFVDRLVRSDEPWLA
jgi:RHS repeat-associated protein